jgi:hypothetical protein
MDGSQEPGFRIQDSEVGRQEFKDVRKLPRMSLPENLSVGHNQRLKTKVTKKEVLGESKEVKRPEKPGRMYRLHAVDEPAGASTISVHLKLNYDATAALANSRAQLASNVFHAPRPVRCSWLLAPGS